jgi:hypothetical protein
LILAVWLHRRVDAVPDRRSADGLHVRRQSLLRGENSAMPRVSIGSCFVRRFVHPDRVSRHATNVRRHIFLLLATLLASASLVPMARAQSAIGVHTVTRHHPQRDYYQEENYGLYYRTAGGIEIGGYRNTLDRASFYVTQTWQWQWFSASLGLTSGYQKHEVEVPCTDGSAGPCHETRGITRGAIGPLAAVSATTPPWFGISARLTILPGFLVDSSTIYHLSFEHPL